jgi:RimJ/RimL family protein N-acetyltransferase
VAFPDDVPVLTDGVVTLRAHRRDDVPAVLEQCTDPLSLRWTTVPSPYSRADAEQFVGTVVPEGWPQGRWAFAVEAAGDDGTPRFAGTVELRDEGFGRAEIAYGAHPWARGRGLVRRALDLLLDWGFGERELRTVVWWANHGNWASRRVAWRLGFSCDGTLAQWLPQRGELLDAWVGVLRAEDPRRPRTPWLHLPRIDGERVVLRGFRDADVARVVEACRDERTGYWLSQVPRPFAEADARTWLAGCDERLATGTALTWAVAEAATDDLVGCVNAFDVVAGRDAEVGYWVHPAARGRGVATEACRLAVRHCLAPYDDGGLGLQRLSMRVAEGNAASRHVVEASGFTAVGRRRRALRLGDNTLVDSLEYDLLREEYAG